MEISKNNINNLGHSWQSKKASPFFHNSPQKNYPKLVYERKIHMKQTQIQSLDDIAILYEDSSSLKKRKEYGQFFTPYEIAYFMVKLLFVDNDFSPDIEAILDPAAGLSIFGHIIERCYGKFDFTAYEIDPDVAAVNPCQYTNMHIENYLLAHSPGFAYSKIIANPPYLKHNYIPDKKRLNEFFSKKINDKIPMTSNYYCYFLIKIIEELAPNGKAVVIVPNEIFSSNYGTFFKKFFLKKRIIEQVFFFENSNSVFRDTIISPVIMVFRKKTNDQIRIQEIERIAGDKVSFKSRKMVSYDDLKSNENWRNCLTYAPQNTDISDKSSLFANFNEYAMVHRGIATGANAFFLFSENERIEKRINRKYLLPCVTSANILKNAILTSEYVNNLPRDKKTLLLNLTDYTGGDLIVDQYICNGEKQNYNKKYLTSHRTPWYAMESISFIGDMLISTFTRSFFRIVINDANAQNLTCVHAIRLKDKYKKYIHFFYAYYQSSLGQKLLSEQSRKIGNGLKKIEPNDVAKVPLPNVSIFPHNTFQRIDSLTKQYLKNRSPILLAEIDVLFCSVLFP